MVVGAGTQWTRAVLGLGCFGMYMKGPNHVRHMLSKAAHDHIGACRSNSSDRIRKLVDFAHLLSPTTKITRKLRFAPTIDQGRLRAGFVRGGGRVHRGYRGRAIAR